MVDLLTVLLLLICICTYVRGFRKGIFDVEDGSHSGLRGEKQPRKLKKLTFELQAGSNFCAPVIGWPSPWSRLGV